MYDVTTRADRTLGIQGYEVIKKYQDPIEQIKQREYLTQKKGLPSKKYLTRRGSFLDNIYVKDPKKYPYPVHYNVVPKWLEAKPKDAKKGPKIERKTFIDDICNPKRC